MRLLHFAETHLPSDELGQLHILPGCLLDWHAGTAYRMLVNRGVDVGFVEEPCWSVYAGIGRDLEMAGLFWEAGFRNMDEPGAFGLESLMRTQGHSTTAQEALEFADWLIAKGADIHRRSEPGCNCPALHHVAYAVGINLPTSHMVECFFSEKAKNIAHMIFVDTSRDICDCPCSVGGCYAVTKLLQGRFLIAEANRLSTLLHDYMGRTRPLYAFVKAGLEHSFETHAAAIIRAFTFEALGIPHTCEHHGVHDADEIDQWKDEIHTLEDLMFEHISVYEESGMSLLSFLEGHWLKRMREVMLTDQPPSHKQISSIRELGVILDETDLGEDEDEDEDEDAKKVWKAARSTE
jgi:hypothetical protein